MKIIKFFINKPKVVNLILIFIFMAGFLALLNVQRQGYPSVDFGHVSISTIYPGASPKDIELKITAKIEENLKSIDGIKTMESWSVENVSSIFV